MRAGALRHKITIYSRSTSKDVYGAMTETYTELCTVRAEVRYLSGSEILLNSTTANTTTMQFIIRYKSNISEEMEIDYNSDRYNIEVIEVFGKNQGMKLTASKIIN